MKEIAIIYCNPKEKLTEFILQSIRFYYNKDVIFHIFTKDTESLIETDWHKEYYPTVVITNINSYKVNFDLFSGTICINSEDVEFLKELLEINQLASYYHSHTTQAIVFKDYINSTTTLQYLLDMYQKKSVKIEKLVFTTHQECCTEIETRIIQDLKDYGFDIEVNTYAEFFEKPLDSATLILTSPFPVLFPILNLTCGKFLIKEILNQKILLTVANTVNYKTDPSKLIFNLRRHYDNILRQKFSNDKYFVPPYSSFSEYYDIYMKHVDYHKWVNFIISRYNEIYSKNPSRILETACGTATMSRLLKERDLNAEACDLVPEMLDIARFYNRDITLFQADMINLNLNKKFDLILCLFDSVNYITSKKDFTEMLKNTTEHLTDEGLFIFDISTYYNSKENFDGFINVEDNQENFLLHRAEFIPRNYTQETELNLFSQRFNCYLREDEIHVQKVWKCKEIIEMVNSTNLKINGIYDIDSEKNLINLKIQDLDNFYSRLFFVLSKK